MCYVPENGEYPVFGGGCIGGRGLTRPIMLRDFELEPLIRDPLKVRALVIERLGPLSGFELADLDSMIRSLVISGRLDHPIYAAWQ